MLQRCLPLLALLILAPAAAAQERGPGSSIPPPAAVAQEHDQGSSAKQPAAAAAPEGTQVRRRGRARWAVAGSYGLGSEINSSKEIDIGSMWVRWTQVLGGPESVAGTKRFLGGQPAVGIEVSPYSTFDQVPRAWGGGWHLVYEHRLRPQHKVRPVLRAGSGMLFTSRNVPPGETRFNYTLFVGAGVEIAVSDRGAIQID